MGVQLVEYDVEKDPARRAEMKALTGGSTMVPVIDVEGIVIRGFEEYQVRAAVESRRKSGRNEAQR